MLNKASVKCTKVISPTMCKSCLEGKFCKLPFQWSINKFVPILRLCIVTYGFGIFISDNDYRYYITFVNECTRHCWIFHWLINLIFFPHLFPLPFITFPKSKFCNVIGWEGEEYISKRFQTISHHKSFHHNSSKCLLFGLMLAKLQFTSSIECQHRFLVISSLLKFFMHGVVPAISHLRIFRCACYPLLKPHNITKLQAKTT